MQRGSGSIAGGGAYGAPMIDEKKRDRLRTALIATTLIVLLIVLGLMVIAVLGLLLNKG